MLTKRQIDKMPSSLKTQYCTLSIACGDLLTAIFMMLKILRLFFSARKKLVNNRWHTKLNGQYWTFNCYPNLVFLHAIANGYFERAKDNNSNNNNSKVYLNCKIT